jgi:hypothetical protein
LSRAARNRTGLPRATVPQIRVVHTAYRTRRITTRTPRDEVARKSGIATSPPNRAISVSRRY